MTRTVLITGCSTGIGRQLADAMHDKGYQVIATARDQTRLTPLNQRGITTLSLDVTRDDSILAARQEIEKLGLQVDILINNAGYGAMGPIVEMPVAEMEKQFATNVYGPVNMVRAFTPMMRQQAGGMIVNVGSV
ncbi:MAG: SDR family NAD(P)-dependent oxidoreductase, partial [Ketobacter sp.]